MLPKENIYLSRYAEKRTYIDPSDYSDPDMILVIPCHNESNLILSLQSLEDCDKPSGLVAVIVVINAGVHASDHVKKRNIRTIEEAKEWTVSLSRDHQYHFILDNDLPKKHAGVGLARKIGMDEAVRIYESNKKNGPIICYDADSSCDPNYLVELERLFSDSKINGCSIHYEHPLEGQYPDRLYEGIINYELHLRCYINLQAMCGFPYAYRTIGSSMAVRSSVYQKQGGMNRRKAGEDFYFLHRIIPLGGFANLNSTKVIPSPRISDRVPFGTGKAIGDWMSSDAWVYKTYAPKAFEALRIFFEQVDLMYNVNDLEQSYMSLSAEVQSFIPLNEFKFKIKEINQYSGSLDTFKNRFFQWFDAFKLMKYVHHTRDKFYPNVSLEESSEYVLSKKGYADITRTDLKERLLLLRAHDKNYSNGVFSSPLR